jgi:hypothetical protein
VWCCACAAVLCGAVLVQLCCVVLHVSSCAVCLWCTHQKLRSALSGGHVASWADQEAALQHFKRGAVLCWVHSMLGPECVFDCRGCCQACRRRMAAVQSQMLHFEVPLKQV